MPLDPSIPLQAKAPTFESSDIAKTMASAATLKKAQIEMAQAEVEDQYKTIAGATPENYQALRAQAVAKYGKEAETRLPPVYDPQAIQSLGMSLLSTKDRLDLLSKRLERRPAYLCLKCRPHSRCGLICGLEAAA